MKETTIGQPSENMARISACTSNAGCFGSSSTASSKGASLSEPLCWIDIYVVADSPPVWSWK